MGPDFCRQPVKWKRCTRRSCDRLNCSQRRFNNTTRRIFNRCSSALIRSTRCIEACAIFYPAGSVERCADIKSEFPIFIKSMSDNPSKLDIATQLVHSGERKKSLPGEPTSTPIYTSSTYTYESMDEIDKVFAGEMPGYVYTRHGNPTVAALEKALLTLESGATSCARSE